MTFIDERKALWQLPAKSPSEILQRLYEIRLEALEDEEIPLPTITLYLHNGSSVTGSLIERMSNRHNITAILLHIGNHPQLDAFYIEEHCIEGVTVHNAGKIAHLLSFGKIWAPPGVAPPSKIEIKKKMQEYAQVLQVSTGQEIAMKVLGKGMPQEGEPLRVLARMIKDTVLVIKKIASDNLGRQTFTEAVTKVVFQEETEAKVLLREKQLVVTGNLQSDGSNLLNRHELREQIEKLLELPEKQWIKQMQEETVPNYQANLQKDCSCAIIYQIDWDSFRCNLKALQHFEHQGLAYVNHALAYLVREKGCQNAINKCITTISIKNSSDVTSKKLVLKGKVLRIQCCWGSDSSGYWREQEIIDQVEQLLSKESGDLEWNGEE